MKPLLKKDILKALDMINKAEEKALFKAACNKVVEQAKEGKFPRGSVLWYEREFKPQANGNR
jgi:hypothetical protein